MANLKGKIAIVTGASRANGIGSAICTKFADQGADLFFTHYTPFDKENKQGEEKWPDHLKEKLKAKGVRAAHMELDLSQPSAPTELLDQVEKELGSPSILINNATFEQRVNYLELDAQVLEKHYRVNNEGTILLSTEFAKRFKAAFSPDREGRIVFLVSGGPDPENLAYIATKGMLKAITYPLAVGMAPLGITVNALDPGPTDTGWIDDQLRQQFLPLFPKGRIGLPEDAARVIAFLASADASWVTGQVIDANGGFLGK